MIDPELEKHNYEKGSAYITFQTTDADLDTNYLETDDMHTVDNTDLVKAKNKEGSTALTTDDQPYQTHKKKSE